VVHGLLRVHQGRVSKGAGVVYLRVYPEMKWYMVCSGVRRLTGGSTPKASQVSRMMLVGCPATQGMCALGMYSMGYDTRVFSAYRHKEGAQHLRVLCIWGRHVGEGGETSRDTSLRSPQP